MPKRWKIARAKNLFKQKKKSLPRKIGNIAKRHFLQNFRRQGFVDEILSPWAARKRPDKGRKRAILVKSGALRASIRVQSASFSKIRVGSYGIPYARKHNRGEGIVQRQFVGPSKQLEKKVSEKINEEIKSLFK